VGSYEAEVPSTLCELCGKDQDTIHQRLYICTKEKVEEARRLVTDKKTQGEDGIWRLGAKEFFDEAVMNGKDNSLYLHVISPRPADEYPAPIGIFRCSILQT